MDMEYLERHTTWLKLQRCKKEGNWRNALTVCSEQHDPLLLWIRPCESILHDIAVNVRSLGVERVVSVGCGTGLFEWLLTAATGLKVTGVEVNRSWWDSKYSPPTFLPLVFADECVESKCQLDVAEILRGNEKAALMFCYFNDMTAFNKYLTTFEGRCMLIIGPSGIDNVHCQPEPLTVTLPKPWALKFCKRIGHSPDWVAMFER